MDDDLDIEELQAACERRAWPWIVALLLWWML